MTMYLAGGGTPQRESLVWQAAFEGVHRVLYWPFALPVERIPGAESWLQAGLVDLGIEAQVTSWASPMQHHPYELNECDLLFVGGGLTSRLVSALSNANLFEHVRRFITEGGRYYGGSAGALLPCEVVTVAAMIEDDPSASGMEGLGLLHGLSVFPHADLYPDTRPAEVAAALGHSVLAIPEASGVAIVGKRLQVLGPEPIRLITQDGVRDLPAGAVEEINR
jgi:dipeptidase E